MAESFSVKLCAPDRCTGVVLLAVVGLLAALGGVAKRTDPAIREITAPPDSARYYFDRGQSLFPNDPRQATYCFEKAASLARQDTTPEAARVLIRSYIGLGRSYGKLQQFLPAYDSCEPFHWMAMEQAIRSFGANSVDAVDCMNRLGGVYAGKGLRQKSLEIRLRALKIAEVLKDETLWQVRLCTNIGLLYDGMGDKVLAERYFAQAMHLLPSSNAGDYVGLNVIENYVQFLAKTNRYPEAIEMEAQAARYLNNRDTLALLGHWETLGLLYRIAHRPADALALDTLALRVIPRFALGPTDIAHTHFRVAQDYFDLQNPHACLSHLDAAIAIERNVFGEKFSLLVRAYALKGRCFQQMGDLAQAQYFLEKSLWANSYEGPGVESIDSPEDAFPVFLGLAEICLAAGRLDEALDQLMLAEKAVAQQRQQLEADPSDRNRSDSARAVFDAGVHTACRLWRQTQETAYLEKAFFFAERSKAQVLYEALRAARPERFAGIPQEVQAEDYAVRMEIAASEQAVATARDTAGRKAAARKLFALHEQHKAFKKRLAEQYPAYFKLQYATQPVSPAAIRQTLLASGQELVEYFIGAQAITAFVLGASRFEVILIPRDFPLESWVHRFRRGICGSESTTPNPGAFLDDYLTYGQLLYQKLVAPLALRSTSVFVIPDGVLGLLPFDALLTGAPRDPAVFREYPFLLKQSTISYCPSATLLHEMTFKRHQVEPTRRYLAFAPFSESAGFEPDLVFPERYALRTGLGPLPHSADEVRSGRDLLMGGADAVSLGPSATKAAFVCSVGSARVVHIATHGFADPRTGDFAFLAFAADPEQAAGALLFIREIYALELNADLVVLSACESGIGQVGTGEGIISLARAFAYAGAKSMVATLWSVESSPTALLMQYFYRGLARQMPKNEALRQAKVDYLSDPATPEELCHPFFWSGIFLTGSFTPLDR